MDIASFFLIFSPAWFLVSFLLYWPLFYKNIKEGLAGKILALRYYGALLFGGIPIVILKIFGFGLQENIGIRFDIMNKPTLWLLSIIAGLIMIVISFLNSRRENTLAEFPQIRNRSWSIGLYWHNIISWLVYLIGYEILFRGLLLFPLVPILGLWPALVFGTVLYSISHYAKSLSEALGAIPFGLMLGWLAWETQSIWPCVLIHCCLAISSSLFSLYRHPDINVVRPEIIKSK